MDDKISTTITEKGYSLNWHDNKILVIKFTEDIAIDKTKAIEITSSILEFVNEQQFNIVIDLQDIVWNLTEEAREIFSSLPRYIKLRKKSVFVINSLAVRLLVNFYQKINLKDKDTNTFTSMEEGIEWLQSEIN